jgi:hypothetical protein
MGRAIFTTYPVGIPVNKAFEIDGSKRFSEMAILRKFFGKLNKN